MTRELLVVRRKDGVLERQILTRRAGTYLKRTFSCIQYRAPSRGHSAVTSSGAYRTNGRTLRLRLSCPLANTWNSFSSLGKLPPRTLRLE